MKSAIINGVVLLVFGFTLNYFINVLENPVGYFVIFILFFVESIRSYIDGLRKGTEIVYDIVGK